MVHSRQMSERNLHATARPNAEPLALARAAEVAARLEREVGKASLGGHCPAVTAGVRLPGLSVATLAR